MRLGDEYSESCFFQTYYTIFYTAFYFFYIIPAALYIRGKTLILALHYSILWYYLLKWICVIQPVFVLLNTHCNIYLYMYKGQHAT